MSNKKIKTSSRRKLQDEKKRKINIDDDSLTYGEKSNLISSSSNSSKIIYPNRLSSKEIDRLEIIENWPLIKSLRKDRILLKESYLNEYGHACEEM